jgi:hypothetical protein
MAWRNNAHLVVGNRMVWYVSTRTIIRVAPCLFLFSTESKSRTFLRF